MEAAGKVIGTGHGTILLIAKIRIGEHEVRSELEHNMLMSTLLV